MATVRSRELLAKIELKNLDLIFIERWLHWYGYAECCCDAVRTASDTEVDGSHGTGRPKITLKKLTENDSGEWKLKTVDNQEMNTWRSGVRSAMHAASQLPGEGPTDVDAAPAPTC